MCDRVAAITFCSCVPEGIPKVVHHKKSRKNKIDRRDFTWQLKRKVEREQFTGTSLDGMLRMPEDSLAENLSAAVLLEVLNTQQCFDFDYSPLEGDHLVVNNPKQYIEGFISFRYQNGHWKLGEYDRFSDQLEIFNYGKLSRDT